MPLRPSPFRGGIWRFRAVGLTGCFFTITTQTLWTHYMAVDIDQNQPPSSDKDKRVCLGVIAQAHGVRGLVKIVPYCEDIGLLEQAIGFDITLKNPLGKYMLAEIAGVSSREDVEAIKGEELFISRDLLPEPDEGEYYVEDLVGLKALNAAGKDAGVIIAVHNFGAGDLLEIKPPTGEAYLVPFNDDHVPEVSADSVTVIPMIDGIG